MKSGLSFNYLNKIKHHPLNFFFCIQYRKREVLLIGIFEVFLHLMRKYKENSGTMTGKKE